jgi:hypothetical protein
MGACKQHQEEGGAVISVPLAGALALRRWPRNGLNRLAESFVEGIPILHGRPDIMVHDDSPKMRMVEEELDCAYRGTWTLRFLTMANA